MTTTIPTKTVFLDDAGRSHDTEEAARTANLVRKLQSHMDKMLCDQPAKGDRFDMRSDYALGEVRLTARLIAEKHPVLVWLILAHQVQS